MNFPIFCYSVASIFLLAAATSAENGQSDNAAANQLNLKRLEAALETPQNVQAKQSDFSKDDLKLINAIFSDLQNARDNNDFTAIGKRSLFGDRDRRLLSALELREMINTYQELRKSLQQAEQST